MKIDLNRNPGYSVQGFGLLTGSNNSQLGLYSLERTEGHLARFKALFVIVSFWDSFRRDGRCESASPKTD
jgi:hypothetical protein